MAGTGSAAGRIREGKDTDNSMGIAFVDEQSMNIRYDHFLYCLFQQ